MNTYLFYDLETTGLNPAFDQILQFAAIRTDMGFHEIETHNIFVKIRPDVIPSPKAMITNKISFYDSEKGLCEFDALHKIHKIMNTPGTISLGYNTINFDEEFLRFSFYRNLLPPYTHQYDKGCRRMDIFPFTIMYYLYKPEVLKWEIKGLKNSLKLEHLNALNKLAQGESHDALVDVNATLELAKRLSKEEKMWRYIAGGFHKQTDIDRINSLPTILNTEKGLRKALIIDIKFGKDSAYQAPAVYIGDSIPYSNQTLWLRLDLPELSLTGLDSIDETTEIIRKKPGEPALILPPLKRFLNRLAKERLDIVEQNINFLDSHPEILNSIIDYHTNYRYPEVKDVDVDAMLYLTNFFTAEEERLCSQFRLASPDEKINFINQGSRQDIKELGIRILCRNYDVNIPKNLLKDYKRYLKRINPSKDKDVLVDYRGFPRLTPRRALLDIEELKKESELTLSQLEILESLKNYINVNFSDPGQSQNRGTYKTVKDNGK